MKKLILNRLRTLIEKLMFFFYIKFFYKEDVTMVEVYVALIIKGRRTFKQVPKILKGKVRQALIDLDLEELIVEDKPQA